MRSTKLLWILLLPLFATNSYGAITIDFGPDFGAPATYVVLTNQLSSYGVTFSSTSPEGVLWHGENPPVSSFSYCINAGWDGGLGSTDPIRVDFAGQVTEASIRGFDGGGDFDILTLRAYDSSDVMVDEDVINSAQTDDFYVPGLVASVSASAIAYITFEVSGTESGLFFDDLILPYAPLLEVEKSLDTVDDEDGDGKVEVGEPVTFTMTITVTNTADSQVTGVEVIDGIGGDLTLVSVDGESVPAPPGTKKKKDNAVIIPTSVGDVTVAWSGKTQKAHLTWDVGTLEAAGGAGDSASLTIVVETDINPGQSKPGKGKNEFTSAEDDHELNGGATATGMLGDVEVGGTSNSITVDVVEPD